MLYSWFSYTCFHVRTKLYYITDIASTVLCQSIFVIHDNNLPAIDRCLFCIHTCTCILFMYIVLGILGGAVVYGVSSVSMRRCFRTQSLNHISVFSFMCLSHEVTPKLQYLHMIYCLIQKVWILYLKFMIKFNSW